MQVVSSTFNDLANGDMRPLSWGAMLSFTKEFDDDVSFFTLDQSSLNGVDLLAPSDDNPIQAWDYYEYADYSERLIYMSVERSLEFPYSVVSAIADFQLNNYDKYLTPNSSSPISGNILPKRPVRLLQGFSSTILSQFVGLTEGMPEVSRTDGTATFTAMDFLTWIYDMPIRNTISMQDVRTDEVLANIFEQFGLAPGQYDLAQGRNVIPFLFFEKEQQTAGDIIRPLMQAEMGMLWLDEQGIIKFRPRLEQPSEPSYLFDEDNIIELDTSEDDQIINHVIINTNVRVLQEAQIVYSITGAVGYNFIIPASSSQPVHIELDDPSINIVEPVFGENVGLSWFSAIDSEGNDVSSNVTLTGVSELTNSYSLFIENDNAFSITISNIVLWGEPAKVVGGKTTTYDSYDDESVAKYEERVLTINNNFIQSVAQAESLSLTLLDEYAEFNDIVTVEVKGNPAIQLSDIVELDYGEFSNEYRTISVFNKVQDAKFTQILKLKKYNPRHWFTLDQSILGGSDVLAP
jgi:hypothetical protein